MQNVALFSNQFADAYGHGLARYARELHAALRDFEGLNAFPVAAWSSMPSGQLEELRATSGLQILPLGRRLTPLLWNYLNFPPIESQLEVDVDIVHAASLGYPIATRKPLIVTIHDLGPLTHPEYFSKSRPWVMERSLRQVERRADAIICVSQSTADEVSGLLGDGIADRIQIVYEGVSAKFFETPDFSVLDSVALPDFDVPFILTAGKMSPRKNLQSVLKAMSLVKKRIPHHLVIVGGKGWGDNGYLKELVGPELRLRIHILDYVTDLQLRALYSRAAVYVHPSLYEGFGLTILEAMASGTPVITSNSTSLPEVAGNAAFLVTATNIDELAVAMTRVCLDEDLSDKMVTLGQEQSKSFNWTNCATQMRKIYAEVV